MFSTVFINPANLYIKPDRKSEQKLWLSLPYFVVVHKITRFHFASHAEHLSPLLSSEEAIYYYDVKRVVPVLRVRPRVPA